MKICISCGSPVPPSDQRCPHCGALMDSHDGKLAGIILVEKYLIEELLGSGGMCDVYRARHIAMDKRVAIKILKPELAADPKIGQRFEQEARAASRVRHPHAINVTDYGIGQNNTPFLVMELIEGKTLRELIRDHGPMTVEQVAEILRQTCGALEMAHSVGVIHRDIKPDNIIISELEGRDWVEVVDFGVAKIQEDVNRRSALTGANFIIGTPRYMSPEQCEEKPVDARSDIYSLGVVVYEMLTGEAPFDAPSSTRLFMAHVSEPPPPIIERRADIPAEIQAIVMRALEKDPERRPQSAMEFAREFEQAAGLSHFARADTGRRSSVFSRISVPLEESSKGEDEAEDPIDDEETLVRRRSTSVQEPAARSDRFKERDTLEDLDEHDPYVTVPEIPGMSSRERNYVKSGALASSHKSDFLQKDSNTPPNQNDATRLATRVEADSQNRNSTSRVPLIIGLFLLSAIIGFIAFLVFGNRNSTTGAPSDQPSASQAASPAVNANGNVAPSAGQPNNNATDATASSSNANTAASQVNPPGEPTEETTKVDTGKVRDQVISVIQAWTSALESKDLNSHMRYYAPNLHTYFLLSNVNRGAARTTVNDYFARYSNLDITIDPPEVRVEDSGKRAIATFWKRWSSDGNPPDSGRTLERVWLRKAGNRWVITGVRDLKRSE